MISVGRDKNVIITRAKYEDKPEEYIYFYGLETIRNPVVCIKGKADTMSELKEILETILNVKIDLRGNDDAA